MASWKSAVAKAALSVAALISAGCAVNPVTGDNEVAFVSESQERAIGQKNYGPYRQAQGGDYALEPELTAYIQQVGDRLAAVSDRELPYEFEVINDSTPNAWALPGGKIAINRGLLVELGSEAELAAVLGHEIVHAAARHSAQAMERSVFLQGALVAAGAALGGSDYRDIGMLGASVGAQLTNQKYSRDAETEADLYGMRYMARAGYDPAAAVDLQRTFVRLAEGGDSNWLEGLFASHPPSRERVEANRKLVAEMGNPGGETGRDRYRNQTARLRRNKPAYEALDEARDALKDKEYDKALKLVDKAISIEPRESAFFSLRGEIKAARGDERKALRDLDRAVAMAPDYFRPLLLRGITRREVGSLDGARSDLERSVELLPTAEGYYGLGRIAEARGDRTAALDHFRKASASNSDAGRLAGQRLARLDLSDNPSRYIRAGLAISRDGYLVVRLSNKSSVAVRDVEIVVGPKLGDGLRREAGYRHRQVIGAGRTVSLRTDLGPMTREVASRYAVGITGARVAD